MIVKIKKFHPNAKIPVYAKEGDAGMDLCAVSVNETDKFVEYGTGLGFELPKGYIGLVFPRGSVSNKDLMLKFSVGVLDSGYRGEVVLRFRKLGEDVYRVGDRVAQIIILPYPKIEFQEVNNFGFTERGEGRFGSTGLN